MAWQTAVCQLTMSLKPPGTPGHLTLNAVYGICYIACCVSFYRAIVLDPGWSKPIEDDEELKEVGWESFICCGTANLMIRRVTIGH